MPAKGKKLQPQNRILTSLQETVADMIAELDSQTVLQKAVERTAELVGADIVTIHIYDPVTSRVRAAAGYGLRDEEAFQQHKPGRGKVALQVVNEGKPVIAEDVSASELAGPFSAREGVRSAASFPLKVGADVIGVLFVNYRRRHKFEPEEVEALVSFGSLAAAAIGNANLIEQERQRADAMDLLQQISVRISATLDEKETLALIIEGAMRLTGTESGVIHLVDEARQAVIQSYEVPEDFGHLPPRFSQKTGMTWTAVSTGQTMAVSDITRDECVNPAMAEKGVKAIIGTPLKVEDKTIGVLFLNDSEPHEFTEYEKELLSTLANHAAIAIQNAHLLADLQRQAKGHRTLNEVGTTLAGILDEEAILKSVARAVADTLDCTHCTVFRVEDGNLVVRAAEGNRGWSLSLGRTFSVGQGVAGWVAQMGISTLVAYTHEDERFDLGWSAPQPDPQSLVVVPILLEGDEVYGVISAENDRVTAFDEQDQRLLETLALQASQAVRNARLFQLRIRDLEIIKGVVEVFSTKLDPQDLLQTIVSQIADQLNCTHCTLFFPQEEKGELLLVPKVTHGVREEIMTRRFKLDEGLAGWVFQKGDSVVLDNVMDDPRFAPAREPRDQPRSMLVAPVKVGDQTIGVISADQDEYGWFSESDRRLVDALAQQAGIAIQRATGLALLEEIGTRTISAPKVDDILQQVVSGAIKLTHTTAGVIYLISEDGKSVTNRFLYPPGFDHPEPRMDREESTTRQVIKTGEMLIFPDAHQDDRVNPVLHDRVRSMIAIPLKLEQKVIGVLFLNDADRHDFTETEVSLLSTLASQAAIAIQNARLFETRLRLNTQLENLHQVVQEQSLDRVLDRIVKGISAILGEETSPTINLYDEETGRFGQCHAYGLLKDELMVPPRSTGGTGRYVLETGEPLYLNDVLNPPPGCPTVRPESIAMGIKSFAALPLKRQEQVVGVLFVNVQKPLSFSGEIRRVLELFASQAGIAIENARMFQDLDERARQLAQLQEVTTDISAEPMDLEKVLHLVVRSLSDIFEGAPCAIRRFDSDSNEFGPRISIGGFKDLPDRPPRPGGTSWYVVKNKVPLYIEDISVPPSDGQPSVRQEFVQMGVRALAYLPLLRRGDVKGVVYVNLIEPHHFSQNEKHILGLLADQAAVAIENARLYAEERRKTEQLRRLNKVGTAMTQVTWEESGLEKVFDEILASIDIVLGEETTSCISLYDQQRGSFDKRILSGPLSDHLFASPPRYDGTGSYVVRTKQSLFVDDVSSRHGDHPNLREETITKGVKSFAVLPLRVVDNVVGTLYIYLLKPYHFSEETRNALDTFADQAAIAIENARLYEYISQDLERRIQELEVLTEMSRGAVSDLGIDQILDLVYRQMAKVMNLSDAQVQIAFYDEAKEEVSFPLAIEQDAGEIIDIVRWGKREAQYRKAGEDEVVQQFKPRARRAPPGLNEYVIRTEQPLLIVEDFEQKATNLGIKVWPMFGRLDRPTHSWLGVPMIVAARVIGVISIQSLEQERAFDQGQQELLATTANQAAVAIENARLFKEKDQALRALREEQRALREEQRKSRAASRLAAINAVAAGFVHKLNNVAGTIPVRARQISEFLDAKGLKYPKIDSWLDAINEDVDGILRGAQAMRSSTEAAEPLELVNVALLVSSALKRVTVPEGITICNNCGEDLPEVLVFSGKLIDTLENLIRNGAQAIEAVGSVTITGRTLVKEDQDWVAIGIKDTGRGIPPSDLPRIFELFFSTKGGMGFGLWGARTLIESLGGKITVSSEVGKGTTFTILLPVEKEAQG